MTKRFAVALDGSRHALRAAELAIECAGKLGAELHLLHVAGASEMSDEMLRFAEQEHVVEHPEPDTTADRAMAMGGGYFTRQPASNLGDPKVAELIAASLFNPVRDRAGESGVSVAAADLLWGDPAEEIAAYVGREGIEMLFVGRRGLGRLEGLVLGSVSAKLASHADCSVVVVK